MEHQNSWIPTCVGPTQEVQHALGRPTLPDFVVEDLPGLLRTATEALGAAGCLMVHGALGGSHLSIDVEGGLDDLFALVTHTRPPLVYLETGTLTLDSLAQQRADLADAELSASERAASTTALDAAEGHIGESAFLMFSVVVNGVRHLFTFIAGWSYETRDRTPQLTSAQEDAEYSEHRQGEFMKRNAQTAELTDVLVADEPFLRLTSYPTRRGRANELAPAIFGADMMVEPLVRGAVTQAISLASQRRADQVIPARTAALRERLPQLAAVLACDPDFAAVSTKQAREQCARALLSTEDPVVPAAPLAPALVTLALAQTSALSL
jgi:hypothetical protein